MKELHTQDTNQPTGNPAAGRSAKTSSAVASDLPQAEAKGREAVARLEFDSLQEQLVTLALPHTAAVLNQELSDAIKHNRPVHRVLQRLLDEEMRQREERRIKSSLRHAALPPGMTLESFDFGNFQKNKSSKSESSAGA